MTDSVDFVFDIINEEKRRQDETVELIASENLVSDRVMAAVGSCLTNKYAEGCSGKRYYGGCQYVDQLEIYCQQLWQQVFNTDYHVNVQPHSGTNANIAAYMALLNVDGRVLSMHLSDGGHLSHGHPINISGQLFDFEHYGLNKYGYIDWADFRSKLYSFRPHMVVIGASAYSREIDYEVPYRILQEYNNDVCADCTPCYMMVDMAHVAGLVATGYHPTPFGYADIVTTTTHKTLR